MRWTHTPLPADAVEALSKGAGLSRVVPAIDRSGTADTGAVSDIRRIVSVPPHRFGP